MNMKKMKKFFTLSRRAEGFTLVELIVVIAILAILGGVAVPAYSGYVKKANMTADQQLVSEVAHALELYYYSHPNEANAGYVVLKPNGASATADGAGSEESIGAQAMQDAFGENWAQTATLKYGEWTDTGLTQVDPADAAKITGSTFNTIAPEKLMAAVTGLTGAASEVVKNYAASGGDVTSKLNSLGFADAASKLNASGLKPGTDEYVNAVSNLLVGDFSGRMSEMTVEEAFEDEYVGTAMQYATLYAYCESTGDTTTMDQVNAYLASQTEMEKLNYDSFNTYISTLPVYEDFNENYIPANGYADMNATLAMMGAVSQISDTITEASDLSNPDLYASDSVANQVNQYMNAVNATAILGSLPKLNPGEILVVMVNGKVTATAGTL